MTVSLDTVIRRSTEILHSDLGDQAVMMDLDAGAYYGLNAVGARIWTLADEPVALTKVVDRLLEEFEVERDECESAVAEFVADMIERKVVEVMEPGS
ncbi:MAG: PqqD family protein [Actinomycetia bacterium]|nr:PqqD family protein [Actinomycetes bacterium]